MKKNLLLIFLGIFILGLIMKKLSLPLSDQILILGTIGFGIIYIIWGIKQLISIDSPLLLRITSFATSMFLAFTLVGIVFRHMWWPISNFTLIFWVIWPLMALGTVCLLLLCINMTIKNEETTRKRMFLKNLLIPYIFIVMVAIPSFFTSTETFCKIFKAYTAEELYHKWDVRKNSQKD